jgi:hypothetical protein
MSDKSAWKDLTAADIEARNARIGVSVGDPRAVGSGQTGKTVVTEGWSADPPKMPPKTSKYRNVRTKIGVEVFDSAREARYWLVLKAREKAGEINDLRRQVAYELYCPSADGTGERQVSLYRADFIYHDPDGTLHVLDSKGKKTREYSLKKKWMELQNAILIEEV